MEDPAKELISEAASLLESLRAMKRVKLKQVSLDLEHTAKDRFACWMVERHRHCEWLTRMNVMI